MGKGANNRATVQRTAREKDAGKMDGQVSCFPNLHLSPLSERLEQARRKGERGF